MDKKYMCIIAASAVVAISATFGIIHITRAGATDSNKTSIESRTDSKKDSIEKTKQPENTLSSQTDKPVVTKKATSQPTAKPTVTKKSETAKPVATKKPATKKPAVTKKPATKKPATKKPEEKTPTTKKPATKAPNTLASKTAKKDFSDAVFVGNSLVDGMREYLLLPKTTYCSGIGLSVLDVYKKKIFKLENGKKGTAMDFLAQEQYNRVYLMFGINEIGWEYVSIFEDKYVAMIKDIRKLQPDATIYVQSILPIAKSVENHYENNKRIRMFNEHVKAAADACSNTVYLDVYSVLVNSKGNLDEDATYDGMHLNKDYTKKWVEYLKNNY